MDPSGHLGRDIARLNAKMNWNRALEQRKELGAGSQRRDTLITRCGCVSMRSTKETALPRVFVIVISPARRRPIPGDLLNIPREKLWFRDVSRAHARSKLLDSAEAAEALSGDLPRNRARARWLRAAAQVVANGYRDTAPLVGPRARWQAAKGKALAQERQKERNRALWRRGARGHARAGLLSHPAREMHAIIWKKD